MIYLFCLVVRPLKQLIVNHFLGPPALIEVNMQVRSMGPISELDMVSTDLLWDTRDPPPGTPC